MILIDVSIRWSYICLIFKCNAYLFQAHCINNKLQTQYLNYSIKIIDFDNANKFTFQTFINYYTSIRGWYWAYVGKKKKSQISHWLTFSYVVYEPIEPTQFSKMVSSPRLGIYIRFDSLSIIRYI